MSLKSVVFSLRYRTVLSLFFILILPMQAQFVHPGLSHKKSDLDRMKYMIEAQIEPYYSSYVDLCNLPTAKYTYSVQGDVSITTYGLEPYGWKDARFNADARAAYYGALRWYIEEDDRYAEKAIEAIMAWTGLTDHQQKMSLTSAPIWLMIEAAEIIRHTYDGWDEADIKKFEDMLVYPGYSNTKAPSGKYTWYWTAYKFDEARAGNQELAGIRTVAAIGVFMNNKIIYDRAMRYVSNLPAREDDLPYARGPRIKGPLSVEGSTEYSISYTVPNPENTQAYPDWGYCGVLPYNIYPNGQNVESSRDQGHTAFSLGQLCTLGEIGWSQGYNFFGLLDSRILKGLEYTLRYCVSAKKSFPDQTTPWEPVTFVDLEGLEEPRAEDADVDFIQITNRTKRNKSQNISPISRENFNSIYSWELPIAHYVGRGFKTEEDIKWTIRARDYSRQENGRYEFASTGQDYTGHGALVYYRPEGCMGDPISGFVDDTIPQYSMNVVPCIIEAENFDYFPIFADGKTYHDVDAENTGSQYRLKQGVDIDVCAEGGYQLSSLEDGEWLNYTIAIRKAGYYNVNLRYAAANADGKVQVVFGNDHEMDVVTMPFGGDHSSGLTDYSDYPVAQKVLLQAGVMAMKVKISGASNSFVINSIAVEEDVNTAHIEAENYTEMSGVAIIKNTSDSEGLSHVTSIGAGDWMTFDVYLPRTQNYTLAYRLAAINDGEYLVLLDNDTIETFAFTSTGGGSVWETQSSALSFPLRAGNHTLKLIAKTAGSNLNWLDFQRDESICDVSYILPFFSTWNAGGLLLSTVQTDSIAAIPGYTITLAPSPEIGGAWAWTGPNAFISNERVLNFNNIQTEESGVYKVTYTNDCGVITKDSFVIYVSDVLHIEAENYSAMSGVGTVATTDVDGGLKVNAIDADDYMAYEINVPYTGNYLLAYRVAGESAGSFVVSLDGVELETISFEATGGDETWISVGTVTSLKLNKGMQTLKITAKNGAWNINWLELQLQDLLLPCDLPVIVESLNFSNEEKVWSSGVIDLSCSADVNLFMNVKGIGELGTEDHLNIYYKLDGGEAVALLENMGALEETKLVATALQGNNIEIIINASTSNAEKVYSITDLKISEPPVFNRIEAEDFYFMYGIQTENTSDVNGNENVGWVHNGDWLMYKDIDLTGAGSFTVRYSSPAEGNSIEMRLDSINGPLIGNMKLDKTGSFKSWKNQNANIIPTDGIYDVYLVLKGGSGYLFNLNWFQYSSTVYPFSSDATLSSDEFPINQETKIISIPYARTLSSFTGSLSTAAGASFVVYLSDGVTLANAARGGYKVVVTAEDGITQVIYTIDYNTGVDNLTEQITKVYPNPATDQLYIQTNNVETKSYCVIDMFGKKIVQGVFPKGTSDAALDISNWRKGLYILQLITENGSTSYKVIKE